jgi:translation initiation factor 2B subunit (eIF-2B alpha/beta/delta family)
VKIRLKPFRFLEEGEKHVKTDNIHGASEVVQQAAGDVRKRVQQSGLMLDDVEDMAFKWLSAYPRMAPFVHLFNTVLYAVERDSASLAAVLDSVTRQSRETKAALYRQLSERMSDVRTIATHSRSRQVIDVLRRMGKQRRLNVILTESRPMNEGRLAATELAEAGISVTLVVDAALDSCAREADVIVVGADRFSEVQVTNKIGTRLLALCARDRSCPIYVLADSKKFLPEELHMPPESGQSPDEIWTERPPTVSCRNVYFEETPVSWFDGIVLEEGMADENTLQRYRDAFHLHPRLRSLIRRIGAGQSST